MLQTPNTLLFSVLVIVFAMGKLGSCRPRCGKGSRLAWCTRFASSGAHMCTCASPRARRCTCASARSCKRTCAHVRAASLGFAVQAFAHVHRSGPASAHVHPCVAPGAHVHFRAALRAHVHVCACQCVALGQVWRFRCWPRQQQTLLPTDATSSTPSSIFCCTGPF